ncbi:MAG: CPBP family intramembrane metalloprotease [Proteobacteria bacterium]|nr:CPBP family intramembrane metalloprotease [Pseudomonadota bacterium]
MRPRYRPVRFFVLTFAISWGAWFGAAWFSRQPGGLGANIALQLCGLLGPLASALILLRLDPSLARDFKRRLTNLGLIRWRYLPLTIFIMPVAAVAAVWLSTKYGRSWDQLRPIPDLAGMIPIMVLAPAIEELGWRGYGVDALRAKLGMRDATIAFALLWALWHAPLFLIAGNYQSGLLGNPVYVANFFISVLPAAVLANWLYEKHRRSIPAAILFHFMLDAVAESFAVEPFTKCIVTGVFIVIAAAVVLLDRKAFAEGPRNFVAE